MGSVRLLRHRLLRGALFLACCGSLFALPACAEAAGHTKEKLPEIKQRIADEEAVLLDVREKKEWDAGHVKGAVHVPISKLKEAAEEEGDQQELKKLTKVLPKDKVIYTHCVKGVRALAAAQLLEKLGYKVRALKPGFAELAKAGFPVVKKEDEKQMPAEQKESDDTSDSEAEK